MQCKVDVAVMIGTGVPAGLRALGQAVCWVVLLNGEQFGTAFGSRAEAQACKDAWLAQLSVRPPEVARAAAAKA
ncbi:hypothetical protein [Pseudomonas sp. RA_35y_Pfl2_P32]|uniref:hypothetical protein n=1 Tax=Pseudomonas sp. RA_35y_Pfl2_P32 TaxID=3088705 RepID=UPI0030DC4F46